MKKTILVTAVLVLAVEASAVSVEADVSPEVTITHVSDPTPPGKVCVIVGDGWDPKTPEVRAWLAPNRSTGKPPANAASDPKPPAPDALKALRVLKDEPQVLTCQLPKGEFGVVAIQVKGKRGWSAPFIVNRAKPQWLSTDKAAPGDAVRALGRNLVNLDLYPQWDADGKPVSHGGYVKADTRVVARKATGGEAIPCIVEKASAYDVHFRLPADLSEGKYNVYVHNGLGGELGWSPPQLLAVVPAAQWPQKVFNVMKYGATAIGCPVKKGEQTRDDTEAVEAALAAAAKNGGGVVYFPAGSYLVTRTMTIPKFTVLKGESQERSWIWLPDGIDHGTREQALATPVGIRGTSDFGIEELSIHGVYNTLVIAAPLKNEKAKTWYDLDHGTPGANNVFIRKCVIYQEPTYRYISRRSDPYLTEMRMSGRPDPVWGLHAAVALRGDHVSVTDCEIKGAGMPIMLQGCRYANVARNKLFTGTAANGFAVFGQYYPTDPMPDKCVFEDNVVMPGTSRNHSGFWNHLTGSRYYFARNSFRLFWVCDVEGILFHGGGKQAILDVTRAQGSKLTYQRITPAENKPHKTWECIVIKGRGLGQSRMIVGAAEGEISLDKPWAINPDSNSLVAVAQYPQFHDHIILDNVIKDAGPGIMPWGDGIGWVIDGNRLKRSGGIYLDVANLSYRPWSGNLFMQVVHNTVDAGRYHGFLSHWTIGSSGTQNYRLAKGLGNVGHVFRGNLFQNDSSLTFRAKGFKHREVESPPDDPAAPVSDVGIVAEDNLLKNDKVGIEIGNGVSAALINNRFQNVDKEVLVESGNSRIYRAPGND